MTDFDARDTDLASWPRELLDRRALAAQHDHDSVAGIDAGIRQYGPDPMVKSWRERHQYQSDLDEDILHSSVSDWDTHVATQDRLRRLVMATIAVLMCALCGAMWALSAVGVNILWWLQ